MYCLVCNRIYLIPDTNSRFWKMQPLWDRESRRKIREKFGKGGFLGSLARFHLQQYMHRIMHRMPNPLIKKRKNVGFLNTA